MSDDIKTGADEFWDLGRLLPQKNKKTGAFSSGAKMSVYEIRGENASENESAGRKITFTGKDENEKYSYVPQGNAFIKRITVTKRKSTYTFYEQFRKNAVTCFGIVSQECPYVPFFSYVPQYSQLNSSQRQYYFYWRNEVRHERYIKCDYCYFWLYVYEILNLPDLIAPKDGIGLLCKVWLAYRKDLPKIDKFMTVWVQDYCMVHGLPAPVELLSGILSDVLEYAEIKEFYLGEADRAENIDVDILISLLSTYKYREGKYFTEANSPVMTKLMLGAMQRVFSLMFSGGHLFADTSQSAKLTKEAFSGSLCTHAIKAGLEIEYFSFRHSEKLKSAVTEAVRYTENKLRAQMRIKSRLSVRELPDQYRSVIDIYFDEISDASRREEERRLRPTYEDKYEPADTVFSIENAKEIEMESWAITKDLTAFADACGAEENSEDFTISNGGKDVPDDGIFCYGAEKGARSDNSGVFVQNSDGDKIELPGGTNDENASCDLGEEYRTILLRTFCGENFSTVCAEYGFMPEMVFDIINEAASESFIGDTVIEFSADGFAPVEEYREDVKNWLQKIRK